MYVCIHIIYSFNSCVMFIYFNISNLWHPTMQHGMAQETPVETRVERVLSIWPRQSQRGSRPTAAAEWRTKWLPVVVGKPTTVFVESCRLLDLNGLKWIYDDLSVITWDAFW